MEEESSFDRKASIEDTEYLITGKSNLTTTHQVHYGSGKGLLIFRIIAALWFIDEWILIATCIDWKVSEGKQLCALTQWGMFTTCCYFIFVVIDSTCKLKLEKTCRIFNMMIFSVEFLITIFFWTALFPLVIINWDNLTSFEHYGMFSWHSVPFMSLLIETSWNKHLFEKKHWWVPFVFVLIYSIPNCIWAYTHERPIYPVV